MRTLSAIQQKWWRYAAGSLFAAWADSSPGHRPEEYEATKAWIAESLLAQFKRHYPRLAPLVDFHELSTPLSQASFVGADRGAMYGLEMSPERLRSASAELLALNPDVIVVGGSEATRAMKEATRSIPIVFIGPSYPVEEGLVASFARPGGNVTGVSVAMSDYVTKLLQLLLDVVPGLSEVALIWSPDNAGHVFLRRDAEAAGSVLKLKVVPVAMASPADVEPALAALSRGRPKALVVLPGPIPNANAERIAELAIRLRMPSMTANKALMERGLLVSYGPDFRDLNRRIPGYVDRILKGARPAEMPVERPTTFELGINLKTAKAIGLVIPPPLLARADTVVQ